MKTLNEEMNDHRNADQWWRATCRREAGFERDQNREEEGLPVAPYLSTTYYE